MIDITEIRSVTDFQRNAKKHVARIKKTKSPMVLTVNGSAAIVVQDAASYQDQVDRLEDFEERQRFVAAIHEGLADVAAGRTLPLREAMKYRGR
jgi:prevent-host-death family protein